MQRFLAMISPADVSVIVPVKGRPALLSEALASILSGKLMPRETIVVVDSRCSEHEADAAAALAFTEAFAARSSVLVVLTGPARGPAAARNLGAARSRSEWIAFLDSDDLWRQEKLAHQWAFLQARPHLDASHTCETWIKDGREIAVPGTLRPVTGRPLRESFLRCSVSASSVMIRRRVFFSLGGFDADLLACEDYDLWIRFFIAKPMGLVPENPLPHVIKRSGKWDQLSGTRGIDLYRVRSLVKVIASGELRGEDRRCAVSALQEKWKILCIQSQKYGRPTKEELEELAARALSADVSLQCPVS